MKAKKLFFELSIILCWILFGGVNPCFFKNNWQTILRFVGFRLILCR